MRSGELTDADICHLYSEWSGLFYAATWMALTNGAIPPTREPGFGAWVVRLGETEARSLIAGNARTWPADEFAGDGDVPALRAAVVESERLA